MFGPAFSNWAAFPHSGRLDIQGGHKNRKTGAYHCHNPMCGESNGKASPKATSGYSRTLYGGWNDADRDCQNTRQEVLIAESVQPVKLDAKQCRVISGLWNDPYTGKTFTNPSDLDIDHFVPLAEVHRSGGDAGVPAKQIAPPMSWITQRRGRPHQSFSCQNRKSANPRCVQSHISTTLPLFPEAI